MQKGKTSKTKIMNRIKIVLQNIAIFGAVFLYCTAFLINDLGLSITLYAGAIGCICAGCFILRIASNQIVEFNKKIFLILILYVIIFITAFNSYDFYDNTKTFYLIISVIALLSFATADYSYVSVNIVSKLILCTGTIFSTLIYFYKLFPNIYRSLIFPFLTEAVVSRLNFLTDQGYSIFVYADGDVSYMLVMILFAVYIALFTNTEKPNIILTIYLLLSVVISQRRTELFFGLMTIALSYIFFQYHILFHFIKRHILITIGIFTIGIGILFAVFLFLMIVPAEYNSASRILMTLHDLKYSIDFSSGRSILYKIAERLIEKHWLFGIGWMNFSHYAGESGMTIVRNVHNIYLQLFLECGIILGSIFIVCLLGILVCSFRTAKRFNYSNAGSAMLMYIVLAGLTDNPIYYPYFWIILWSAAYISGITQITHQNGGHV